MGAKLVRLYTPRARLAFASIGRPKKNQRGEDRYTTALVFDPGRFTLAEQRLWDALHAEVAARLAELRGGRGARSPFKEGKAMVREDGSFWSGFGEGLTFFDAATKFGPADPDHPLLLVDAAGQPLGPEAFYSGCYARAKVHAYAYQEGGNRGVSFGLDGLQWLADGERLGGSRGFEDAPPVDAPPGSAAPARPAPPSRAPDAPRGAWAGPTDDDGIPF